MGDAMTSTDILERLIAVVAICAFCSVASAGQPGLVAHWDCDEGSGTILHDKSGNNNHGKIKGAAWVKSGKGYALKFDGKDDYVDCGNGPSLNAFTDELTVEARIYMEPGIAKPAREGVDTGIVVKGGLNYGLTYYKGKVYFYINGGGNYIHAPVTTGRWHRILATYDREKIRLYVDGQEKAVKDYTRAIATSIAPGPLLIGGFGGNHFDGMIAEVKVFARAFIEDRLVTRLYYSEEQIIADLNLRHLQRTPAKVRVELFGAEGGRLVVKTLEPLPPALKPEVTLSVPEITPGDYSVRAVALDEAGNEIARFVKPVSWPRRPRWLGSKQGITEDVLDPWTPIEAGVQGNGKLTVHVWGRRYEFLGFPLPNRIKTAGKVVTSRPVRLIATVGGASPDLEDGPNTDT